MKLTDQDIEAIARRIAGDLRGSPAPAPAAAPAAAPAPAAAFAEGAMGVFKTVDEATAAAKAAFPVFSNLCLSKRAQIIENIRAVAHGHNTIGAARVLGNRYYLDTGGWMDGRGHFSLLQLDTLELQRWPRAD